MRSAFLKQMIVYFYNDVELLVELVNVDLENMSDGWNKIKLVY